MARLSSPESVLKKLSEVDQNLIDLYETVDLIKSLHDDLKKSYEKSKDFEGQLEKKILEIDVLEKAHGKAIKKLEDIAESSEEELKKISYEFDEEKQRIDKALQPLISEKIDLEEMRRELDDAMSYVDQVILEKVAHFETKLEKLINDFNNAIAQVCDDGKNRIDKQLKHLSSFKDGLIKDFKQLEDNLKNDLGAFKNRLDSELKQRTDDLFSKIDIKISEQTEKLRISTEKKINEFLGQQKNLIGNLIQRIDGFVGIASDLQSGLKKIDEKQRQVIAFINKQKNYIMKLDKRILQIEQTNVSDLERRIGTIENTLEEMQKKRRLWPFSK